MNRSAFDIAHASAIIVACYPEFDLRSCEYLSRGWDSIAVLVNGGFVFRFPQHMYVEAQYRMEAALLAELAERVSLQVPQFQFLWNSETPYKHIFVGYPVLAGEQLRAALLATLGAKRIAEQLARFLIELHTFPIERATEAGVPGGASAADWRTKFAAQYADIRARVFPLLAPAEQQAVAKRWELFLNDDAHFQFAPVLIHADLSSDHLLVDRTAGVLSGVIDWGDASLGDPALDFAGLLADYGEDFTQLVLAHYPTDDPTLLERAAFYVFVMPFNEILFGLDTAQQAHVDNGLATLRNEF